MRKEQGEASARRAANEHAGDAVAPAGPGHEGLDGVLLPLRVLPVSPLGQVQAPTTPSLISQQRIYFPRLIDPSRRKGTESVRKLQPRMGVIDQGRQGEKLSLSASSGQEEGGTELIDNTAILLRSSLPTFSGNDSAIFSQQPAATTGFR
eukprot:g46096.t1